MTGTEDDVSHSSVERNIQKRQIYKDSRWVGTCPWLGAGAETDYTRASGNSGGASEIVLGLDCGDGCSAL